MADLGANARSDQPSSWHSDMYPTTVITTYAGGTYTQPSTFNPWLGSPRKFIIGTEEFLFDQNTRFLSGVGISSPAVNSPGAYATRTPPGASGNGADGGFWSGLDSTVFNNATPSQRQGPGSILKSVFWPVTAGDHSISVTVKMTYDPGSGYRPQIIVKANQEVGVLADVAVEAGASMTTWQTVVATISPTTTGVVEVWRTRRDYRLGHSCWWDDLAVS